MLCPLADGWLLWGGSGLWPSSSQLLSAHSLYGEELLVGSEEAGSITLGQYLRQLARHQNFLWFVGMDLVQVLGVVSFPQ